MTIASLLIFDIKYSYKYLMDCIYQINLLSFFVIVQGKVIDFEIQNRTLVRVKFNCFYLDQSRLVSPNRFEGNYNIFYQLLAGLTPEERGMLSAA